MIGEGDSAAVPREADMADPTARFVENLSDRVFEATFRADPSGDGDPFPVRSPVRREHVVGDRPRCAPEERDASELPDPIHPD